jgi:hypothetical protein
MPRDWGFKWNIGGRETRLGIAFPLALVLTLDKSLVYFTNSSKKAADRHISISHVVLSNAAKYLSRIGCFRSVALYPYCHDMVFHAIESTHSQVISHS